MRTTNKNRIEGWRDLERFGFIMLTGEACGIGLRVLVDLTPEGLDNLNTFLSVNIPPGNNWNTSDGQIASAMLPWDMWRQLGVYCLLGEGHNHVVDVRYSDKHMSANWVRGMTTEEFEAEIEGIRRIFDNKVWVWYASGTAKSGLRNRHEWTGRVE